MSLQQCREEASRIRLVIFDVDGVLTDGKLYFTGEGVEIKAFSTLDGHGIKMLQASGVKVGIITGRNNPLVAKRARDLGIELLWQGREDKVNALEEMLSELNISQEEVAYLGDDLPDLPVMRRVGLGVAVPGAHPFVRKHAQAVTKASGGQGAARELCDFIMDAQNTLESALQAYL